jgi:FkbM family methyltransferase
MNQKRPSAVLPLRALLSVPALRRRLAFALKQDYMSDLQLRMPLEPGLSAPLDHWDAFIAFSETFLSNEYGNLFQRIPLPGRWLDLGCHRGYFSLWVAWEKARQGIGDPGHALLIDADPRAETWFKNLQKCNPTLKDFRFLQGAVATPESGDQISFAQREGMGSVHPGDMPVDIHELITVPRLKTETVVASLAPPYDLIKVDIEGAEFALLETMGGLIAQARHLVIEWHGWNDGGVSAQARLSKAAAALGFGPPADLRPNRSSPPADVTFVTGTHLYQRLS